MQLEDLKRRARQQAETMVGSPQAGESFRRDVLAFFATVPEPPVYRRRDDPARARALAMVEQGVLLLARGSMVEGHEALRVALESHLEALSLIADNRVEAAEPVWQRAQVLERQATAELRLWRRSDEGFIPVFDRTSGRSKYDPQPEATVHVTLACPVCRKVGEFAFSPGLAMHAFSCRHCTRPFHAYFGEVRSVEVSPLGSGRRHYVFRVDELGGAQARVEFDDGSTGELAAAPRDLLAFIYEPETRLRGVLNLNSSRVLWLAGGCFVATAVFGEGAAELVVLRRFRDEVLARSAPGRGFIEWYYRRGPALAGWVSRRPAVRAAMRGALRLAVRRLSRGSSR